MTCVASSECSIPEFFAPIHNLTPLDAVMVTLFFSASSVKSAAVGGVSPKCDPLEQNAAGSSICSDVFMYSSNASHNLLALGGNASSSLVFTMWLYIDKDNALYTRK